MEEVDIVKIIGAVATLYPLLLYALPPKWAHMLSPIGKFLNAIANTPGGLRWK